MAGPGGGGGAEAPGGGGGVVGPGGGAAGLDGGAAGGASCCPATFTRAVRAASWALEIWPLYLPPVRWSTAAPVFWMAWSIVEPCLPASSAAWCRACSAAFLMLSINPTWSSSVGGSVATIMLQRPASARFRTGARVTPRVRWGVGPPRHVSGGGWGHHATCPVGGGATAPRVRWGWGHRATCPVGVGPPRHVSGGDGATTPRVRWGMGPPHHVSGCQEMRASTGSATSVPVVWAETAVSIAVSSGW
jgi:hypothetical protein